MTAHLVARSKTAVQVFSITRENIESGNGTLTPILQLDGSFRSFKFTADGSRLLIAGNHCFTVFSFTNENELDEEGKLEIGEWSEFSFGPLGGHVAVVDKQRRVSVTRVRDRLTIWEGINSSGSGVAASAPKWNADETAFARIGKNELRIGRLIGDSVKLESIPMPGLHDFSWSPVNPAVYSCFCRPIDGQPAIISIHNQHSVLSQKTFRVDRVEFCWHPSVPSVLITATSDVDQSGQSYYGETALFLLSLSSNAANKVALDKEGPVHDVAWAHDSFICLYGYTPASASIFDGRTGMCRQRLSPQSDGKVVIGSKNIVRIGDLVAFGGFGNLPGKVEVWSGLPSIHSVGSSSAKPICRVGQFDAAGSSILEWAGLSGQLVLLTAITHPRLRVDNCWRIWKWSGGESACINMPYVELYQVAWRPVMHQRPIEFDDAAVKVAARISSDTAKKAEPYRPPSLRSSSIIPPSGKSKISKEEKLLKRLEERLDQITELKAKKTNGDKLEANQLEKIEREAEVRKELDALKKLMNI